MKLSESEIRRPCKLYFRYQGTLKECFSFSGRDGTIKVIFPRRIFGPPLSKKERRKGAEEEGRNGLAGSITVFTIGPFKPCSPSTSKEILHRARIQNMCNVKEQLVILKFGANESGQRGETDCIMPKSKKNRCQMIM